MTQSRFMSIALAVVIIPCLLRAALPSSAPVSGADPAGQVITVVLRMDDYSDAMSTNLETAIVSGIERYRLPVVFAAIPYLPEKGRLSNQPDLDRPLSRARVEGLRPVIDAGLLEIAQHGYSHRSNAAGGLSGDSEFSGLPPEDQRARILKGKARLEELLGRPVVSFCPPFNRYDVNTVRVLASSGFTTLSAGGYCHADGTTPLRYLPATCKLIDLPLAVEAARHVRDPHTVIVVLFHPYDFIEEDAARGFIHYAELDALLAWISQQRDVRVLTLDRASREIPELGAERYRAFYQCHALSRLLPAVLVRRIYPPSAYWTVHRSWKWDIKLAAWLIALLGAGFLCGGALARALCSWNAFGARWLGWVGAALILAGGVRFILHPGFPGSLLVAVGVGVVAGRLWPYGKK